MSVQLAFAVLSIVIMLAKAAPAQLVAVEPEQAGPDFAFQGEYAGKSESGGKTAGQSLPVETDFAAQVIALGGGNFRVVFFQGGLPGAGWDGQRRYEAVGTLSQGTLDISGDEYHGTLRADSMTGATEGGDPFRLVKLTRGSPSLGMAPPPGATVLFGTGGLEAWDNASVDGRGFFSPLEPFATTRKFYADFSLHLEFRQPFMPFAVSQSRGNSGLKFLDEDQVSVELQILDSFGSATGLEECGALEGIYPPNLIASFPPLAWQTFDIQLVTTPPVDSSGAGKPRITVWQNGILIQADREFPMASGAVALALQQYNESVFFRNIWLVEGNARYPFFPGAAIRERRRTASGGHSLQSPAFSVRKIWMCPGQGGNYLSNGSRVP